MEEIRHITSPSPAPSSFNTSRVSPWVSERKSSWNQRYEALPPKKFICHFWKNEKGGCRFTEEQCKHLHEDAPGVELAVVNGRPDWGAAADFPSSHHQMKPSSLTCYWWANGGCKSSECKFVHAFTEAGVAVKPYSGKKNWGARESTHPWRISSDDSGMASTWRRGWNSDDKESEVASVNDSWGHYDDKPDHVRAVEDNLARQTVGW
jgi:hypothetical protein